MTVLSNTSGLSLGSHTKVRVECDLKLSDNCRDKYDMPYKDTVLYRANNGGKIACIRCVRFGKKVNPNTKFDFDDSFMATIDTEAKSYLLGWIASSGTTIAAEGSITITVDSQDECSLEKLRDVICPEIPITSNSSMLSITFASAQIVSDSYKHLQIEDAASKCSGAKFPQFSSKALALTFIRGFFDGEGSLTQHKTSAPRVTISSKSSAMLKSIGENLDVPFILGDDAHSIVWTGVNALDFLGKIYDGSTYHLRCKYNMYMELCAWCPTTSGQSDERDDPTFAVTKTCKEAVIPSKSRASDSGYDLTIIKTVKPFGPSTTLYDTCIKVRPPAGFYMDVVPRSSLSKSGYMLANSVGIIDRAYTGSIMIALIKVDPTAPDIQLPFCGFQMIPRPIIHFQVVEVTPDMLEDTGRGAGGFGSTEERAKAASASVSNSTNGN